MLTATLETTLNNTIFKFVFRIYTYKNRSRRKTRVNCVKIGMIKIIKPLC